MADEGDGVTMLLEVLDSTPVVDGRAEDRFADDGEAAAWLTGHGQPAGGGAVGRLRRVRADLQAVVRGEAPATALADWLAGVTRLPELDEDGLHWRLSGADGAPARLVLAWAAVQHDAPGRLRPCGNDDCRRFLLDRSRNNTGRWCSMEACGNRMKARRHRARTAGADSPSGAGS